MSRSETSRHDVTLYATVRVKVAGVKGESDVERIKRARAIANLDRSLSRVLVPDSLIRPQDEIVAYHAFADEVTAYVVDESNNGESVREAAYWEDGETPLAVGLRAALTELKARGLTFSDCIHAFGKPIQDSAHAAFAKQNFADDETAVDDVVVVEESGEGAWVSSWLWVRNGEVGLPDGSDDGEDDEESAEDTMEASEAA